jgi:hypothetical protein
MSFTNADTITLLSYNIADNTGNGVEFISNSNDIQFIGGGINRNGGAGIKLTATSDRNVISNSSIVSNVGFGIQIAAATCDNNLIIGNQLVTNTAGQFSNAGTGTKLRGCIGQIDVG